MDAAQQWWKSACVYQIYPASFKDSNGDGFGDLQGILSKLDYVKSLGVDAVWISPFFETPNVDGGYDISDYRAVDPRYGSLADADAIIKGCHDRGLKVLFDLVINHTSHLHRWFLESEKSKDNPYRKFYHWRPPRYDADGNRMPPTNWRAVFGDSVWEYSERTGEYYLHLFTVEQPDLNWEDKEVRKAIYEEAVTFWLERGVDGFRVDVSGLYSKHAFEDVEIVDELNYVQPALHRMHEGPNLHTYLQELNAQTFAKYGAVTIAELPGKTTNETMLKYLAAHQKKYDMAIRFNTVYLDHFGLDGRYYMYHKEPYLPDIKAMTKMEQDLADPKFSAWLATYFESHDQARSVSRFGNDSVEYREVSAKMLCIFMASLSGTLLLYQGQEIGTPNMPKSWPLDEYRDPATTIYWKRFTKDLENGLDAGFTVEGAIFGLQKVARDHARTPMQWSANTQAGFSTAEKTWMRVSDHYTDINVEQQEHDVNSTLNLWRKMLDWRKQHPDIFTFGRFDVVDAANDKTFLFKKSSYTGKDKSLLFVALNFTEQEQPFSFPQIGAACKPKLLASAVSEPAESVLAPWEGRVYLYAL